MADLFLIARLEAVAGKGSELRQALQAMLAPSQAEEGCKAYQLYEEKKGELFYFFEIWASKEALEKHTQTPHYIHLQKVKDGLFKSAELSVVEQVQ